MNQNEHVPKIHDNKYMEQLAQGSSSQKHLCLVMPWAGISHWPLQFGFHHPSCPSLISGDLSLRPLLLDSVLCGLQLDVPSGRCSLGSGNSTSLLCLFGLRSDNNSPVLWALDIPIFYVVFPKPWPHICNLFLHVLLLSYPVWTCFSILPTLEITRWLNMNHAF